jgi:membrane-bound lytic murein transglycosylase B
MKLTQRLTVLSTLFLSCALAASPGSATASASTSASASAASSAPASASKPAKRKTHKAAPKKLPKKPAPKTDYVGEAVNFGEWKAVNDFATMMVTKHQFERSAIDAVIAQIRFVDSAVQLVKPAPPGKPKNWHAYSNLFIEPVRIKAGVTFWNDNAATLAKAEAQFGVPAEIIVGIIGVETVYGRNTGRFRVLDALTTLAFAYPETPNRAARMDFFRDELEQALLLARKEKIDPFSLLGSFAGAVGMPQFMPSSVLQFGVDYDGDGIIDLRNSPTDVIGSVANYLATHGWQPGASGPIVYTANVSPNRAWEGLIGRELVANLRADQLQAAGVVANQPLPEGMLFGLIDLQNGADPTEFWLGNANFFAITQYNRSFFYAMSVIDLGRAVRQQRGG